MGVELDEDLHDERALTVPGLDGLEEAGGADAVVQGNTSPIII